MLSDLLYEKGQDRFEDYKFSGKAWSAPCLEDPAKIRELLDSFHLVGRRIKKLRLIGLNYTQTAYSTARTRTTAEDLPV